VGGGEGYLKPRLEPGKLEEISRGLEASSKKQQEDHFYLMGRDENNEPRRIIDFDTKMVQMRETGFSPHKRRGSGFVPKKRPVSVPGACGFGGAGRVVASAVGVGTGTPLDPQVGAGPGRGRGQGGDGEDIPREVLDMGLALQETAGKIMDDRTFEDQVDAMLSIVEMGKEEIMMQERGDD
jgi:hypothetical protein